jgi:putative redox protein
MTISIIRDKSGAMRHHVHIGKHVIAIDEPPANGGEDSGPDPHDLYDAALGACKALTTLWYAKRKGIPVEDIQVDVTRDASEERSATNATYRLDVKLTLGGELSEAQRQELLNVAGKCPVHRLMTTVKTEITTSLA